MYYFFPYYTFDFDKTLIYFIAGRYEFHDKGIDTFIEALSKLNERMKKDKTDKHKHSRNKYSSPNGSCS